MWPILLHAVLEQRPQQIGILTGEFEIAGRQPMQLRARIGVGDSAQLLGEAPNRLTDKGQDQAVEVAKLIIDATD